MSTWLAVNDRQRLPAVPGGLDWQEHGLQPRWLGMETSDCVVALEPSIFHGRGADELDRFLAGARVRDELALVVAVIGDADDDRSPGLLSRFDSSIHLNKTFTTVYGRRLPAGTRPQIAPDLSSADRDLASGCSPAQATPRGGACSSAVPKENAAMAPDR